MRTEQLTKCFEPLQNGIPLNRAKPSVTLNYSPFQGGSSGVVLYVACLICCQFLCFFNFDVSRCIFC